MTTIGLVPGSFKPYQAGHDALVRLAADQNDVVHVYVSVGDRDNVSGKAMARVWKELIEPSLPKNVNVVYGGTPVRHVYEVLGKADKERSDDVYTVYSDPADIKANYGTLGKYAGDLIKRGKVVLRGVPRALTVNVSGTMMRGWLAAGDKKKFVAHLPQAIDGNRAWQLLSAGQPKAHAEALLRQYVGLLLRS